MNKNTAILLISLLLLLICSGFFFFYQYKQKSETINYNQPENSGQTEEAASTTPAKQPEPEVVAPSEQFIPTNKEISRGNINKKQLIFTFDCGSSNNSADKILEVAQKHDLKITFFATGKFAEKYPDDIKKFSVAGHEVFNHTYDHPYLTKITDGQITEEFEKTDNIISSLTGKTTKPFFRPPYGDRNQHVRDLAQSLGYQEIYWTTDALDWQEGKTNEQTKERIYSSLKNGGIIMMHVGDDITGQILDEVFTYVENQGYEIVPLSEGIK
jgi:peptidoglycan/xylan/chitin deacetylase (PgdA/CDA1 family)